jgi:serine/threonine protein kinase
LSYRKSIWRQWPAPSQICPAAACRIALKRARPENLFVTAAGRVKILDFGLAKMKAPQTGEVDTDAPTQKKIPNPGMVMGTVGYMSLEPVRGQEADSRSDILSFGVILYEMLSGRRTFAGESAVEVMNAILKEEPPELSETNAKISLALDRIVRRCLEGKLFTLLLSSCPMDDASSVTSWPAICATGENGSSCTWFFGCTSLCFSQ